MTQFPKYSCSDIVDAYVHCCTSCHDDANEFGDPLMQWDLSHNQWAEVCCGVHKALQEGILHIPMKEH